jgi:hypothetical protein
MTIPGFTAEASLYTTSGYYKLGAGWADGTREYPGIPQQSIIPQRIKLITWVCDCPGDTGISLEGCTCVREEFFTGVFPITFRRFSGPLSGTPLPA